MEEKKEKIMRFGIGTKGFVYCLIGGLTLMAALGQGGSKSDSGGALEFLRSNPFGMILLGATTAGILAYVFWRFYQAIKDPEEKGNDTKGLAKRAGYLASGIFYSFLAFTAVDMLLGLGGGGGGSGNSQETIAARALSQPFGQILVAVIATGFLGKALYQMYRAYTEKYRKKLKEQGLSDKTQKLVLTLGKLGYTARGIVIGVIAFLFYKAALTYNSDQAGGTSDAFGYLQDQFGTIVMAIIAAGLIMYGVFLIVKARHRDMSMI
ncbi:MAG: DUF1206 domain-containing protein [Bacteroidales bacterium]